MRNICTRARADMPLFRILETAGRIALKFGVWLGTHELGVLQTSRVGYICTCARADVHLFCISEMAGPIALKVGVSLGTH